VELDPEQEQTAFRNIGAQRKAYNWAVATIQQEYRGGDKRIWSPISLRNRWYEERDQVAPWWRENSKEAYSSGIANAVKALKNFQDGRAGERPDRPGFPKFKEKATAAKTFTATTGIALRGNRELVIPHVGIVRSKESLRRLRRAIDRGDLRITSLKLWHKAGKWYVSIQYRTKTPYQHSEGAIPNSVVGVDLGIGKMLSTASDGQIIHRPKNLKKAMSKSAAANRRTKRRTKDSSRWKAAKHDASRAYARERNIRKQLIHKETARLAKTHGVVVIENLAVKAMAKGWGEKSAARSGMREFRRQIEYKANLALVADRFYPSSKTCSKCHVINQELELKDDIWSCVCGVTHQRDENASDNLAQLGAAWMDGKTVPCVPHDQVKRKPRPKRAQVPLLTNSNEI